MCKRVRPMLSNNPIKRKIQLKNLEKGIFYRFKKGHIPAIKFSKKTRKKLSEKMKGNKRGLGHKYPEEIRKRLSIERKGQGNPAYNIRGKKHYNWKGGITQKNQLIRHSFEYKEWRKSIFKRDNFTCQSCNKKGDYLVVHHIKPFSTNPELRFEISNGITFCKNCHKKVHIQEREVESACPVQPFNQGEKTW